MCLSIAVLCFGVFSAVSVSYSISGTISYTVTDAFVKVSSKVYKGTNQYKTDTELETLAKALADGTKNLADNGFTAENTYSISDYDSTSGENFAQTINLILSSTNKSYLIEITIQNLSPSVNVWAKANWELKTGSNIVQGNNSSQPTISSTAAQKIYFIVSIADLTASISNTSYSMGLGIGIGDMPIEAKVNNETITVSNGTTWAEFIKDKSEYTTITENSESYIKKDGEVLRKECQKVRTTDAIEKDAKYYKLTLIDGTKYWYLELGKLTDGTAIRWQLVSLDGENAYTYTSDEPEIGSGSIFVQMTYVSSSVYKEQGTSSIYKKTAIREYLKNLEVFGDKNQYGIEEDPGYIAIYTDESVVGGEVTGDMFWLLSEGQANGLMSRSDRGRFDEGGTYINWWVRVSGTDWELNERGITTDDDGNVGCSCVLSQEYAVRAAFQLA